ncbi:MAG: hydrogenase iron-sulfur subunit [Candidatus Lokiarchaeota archaeon]|nr:hydrogenase iron-sulfur subunit [Candidatus Lokiarchaeota archaeon]
MGECDFNNGNLKAKTRIEFVKRLLDRVGLDGNRVNLYECGAAEFNRFLEAVADTMEKLEKVGKVAPKLIQ